MTSQDEFVVLIAGKLVDAGIPYMIAGSFLANLYGQPRATHDTDVVVKCGQGQLELFAASLDADHYVSQQSILDAIAQGSMFNVIDTIAGWKADIIIQKDRPFSVTEFGRRRPVPFHGEEVWVASPEDAVLSKLEWAEKSGSQRQILDAASIVTVQGSQLDVAYLHKWAIELGVVPALNEILNQADVLRDADSES